MKSNIIIIFALIYLWQIMLCSVNGAPQDGGAGDDNINSMQQSGDFITADADAKAQVGTVTLGQTGDNTVTQVLFVINFLSVYLHSVQSDLYTSHKMHDSSTTNKTEQSDVRYVDDEDDYGGVDDEQSSPGDVDSSDDKQSSDDVHSSDYEQSSDDVHSSDDNDSQCDDPISNLLNAVTNLIAQIGPIQILSVGDVNSEQKIEKNDKGNEQASEDDGHSNGNHVSSNKGSEEKSYGLIIDLLNSVTNLLAQIGPIQLLSAGDIYHKQSIEKADAE